MAWACYFYCATKARSPHWSPSLIKMTQQPSTAPEQSGWQPVTAEQVKAHKLQQEHGTCWTLSKKTWKAQVFGLKCCLQKGRTLFTHCSVSCCTVSTEVWRCLLQRTSLRTHTPIDRKASNECLCFRLSHISHCFLSRCPVCFNYLLHRR